MKIGVPREIKTDEHRVAMVPSGVHELADAGHDVFVETACGEGSGHTDDEYRDAGATVLDSAAEVWESAEMIVKVKEPMEPEWGHIRDDHVLFTYFHFAADEALTRAMVEAGATCIAYETVEGRSGDHPLLTPMSEVAGRMSVQEGAKYLEKPFGGRGVMLGGVAGVPPSEVVVIGGGVVGRNAARVAAGLGARVTILDRDLDVLRRLEAVMPANVGTLFSNTLNLRGACRKADILVGAVYISGSRAPTLVDRQLLKEMKDGAVIVDVAVDQGGCVETIRPTTHSDPVYEVEGVLHYGVANMPGAVARTSTLALTHATEAYVRRLADAGWRDALAGDPLFAAGLNMTGGKVVHAGVSDAFDLPLTPREEVLSA